MANPTKTAQNTWVTTPGVDFLQMSDEGGGPVAWIDSNGAGQGLLSSPVLQATYTLTHANLLNISSGIPILPAPGATKMYNVIGFMAHFNFIAPAYTSGGTNVVLALGTPGGTIATLCTASHVHSATNLFILGGDVSAFGLFSLSDATALNAPLIAFSNTNFATGNGTLTVTINYSIVDITNM